MNKKTKQITVRVPCKFSLEDDDSGGPTGPDYLVLDFIPNKSVLKKHKLIRDLHLSVYFKEKTDFETGKKIKELLTKNSFCLQYQYFK